MRFFHSLQFLLSFSTLAAGFVVPRQDTVDPDNPEASNPKTPPKVLNRPVRPENLIKKAGIKTAPDSCTDLMNPSQQCIADLQAQPGGVSVFSGGELKWDEDHQCTETQQGKLIDAAWDAHTLADFFSQKLDGHVSKDIALYKTWMGPDFALFQKRIAGTSPSFSPQLEDC